MAEERRIFGPPGTGKTYTLCNVIIPEMVKLYGADRVMVTSFTKTAAVNIATRAGLDNREMHGTLHSLVYQELGQPELVDLHMKEWNALYPQWQLNSSISDSSSIQGQSEVYSQYQINLNRLVDKTKWSNELLSFDEEWTKFKQNTNSVDFVDLIIKGINEIPIPPHRPQVIIVDEAQDFTALQLKLVRSWGKAIPRIYLALDDDQAIYFFQGTDPIALLQPDIPADKKIFLTQSYRVPALPHKFAMGITDKISFREEKTYKPTGESGEVLKGEGNFSEPTWAIDKAIEYSKNKRFNANAFKENYETSMFMTSCSYMLDIIISQLREKGIPFHNPYKLTDKKWNPLSTNASAMLYAFLSEGEDPPYWSTVQLLAWIKEIKIGDEGLIRGSANKFIEMLESAVEEKADGLHTCREYLTDLFNPGAIDFIMKRDISWLERNVKKQISKTLEYPKAIIEMNGNNKEVLRDKPLIMIGTIHSFKGTEADNVFLYPDVSYAAKKDFFDSVIGQDNSHRLMYVGATRTLNRLIIMPPSPSNRGNFYKFDLSKI